MPDWIKYGLLGTVIPLIVILILQHGFGDAEELITVFGFIGGAIVGTRKNNWIWALAGGAMGIAAFALFVLVRLRLGLLAQ